MESTFCPSISLHLTKQYPNQDIYLSLPSNNSHARNKLFEDVFLQSYFYGKKLCTVFSPDMNSKHETDYLAD